MLRKMVEPAWGNRLVTDITKSDVAKFLDFVAEGRPRPCKQQAQQPGPQAAGPQAHPDPRQPRGRNAAQDVHAGHGMGLARRTIPRRASTGASSTPASGS
jgi:hypothetical protein